MKLKIKSFNIGIPIETMGFFIPKTNTIYYNKALNKYPNLKKVVIEHEKQHSKLFKGKMTSYKILQNLEFELRDSVHWRLQNPNTLIEKMDFYDEQRKLIKKLHKITNKKLLLTMQIYMFIYQLWILILVLILMPYEIYIKHNRKKYANQTI